MATRRHIVIFSPRNRCGGRSWVPAFAGMTSCLAAALSVVLAALMTLSWLPLHQAMAQSGQRATLEPGEERPGGDLTAGAGVDAVTLARFPVTAGAGMLENFAAGGAVFRKIWVSAPSSTVSSSGLGPLYNARSCEQCHVNAGRGKSPRAMPTGLPPVSLVLRLSVPPRTDADRMLLSSGKADAIGDPVYGLQLQTSAIQGHRREGQLEVRYTALPVRLSDGELVVLQQPSYRVTDLAYGPLHPDVTLSPRIAPPLHGLGLLEAIDARDIQAWADPGDSNGDAMRGRFKRVDIPRAKLPELGRFGWKTSGVSLHRAIGEAFAVDMGLSNRVVPRPSGDCTQEQTFCMQAPNGEMGLPGQPARRHEVDDKLLDLVVDYVRNLAVPPRRDAASPDVLEGKALFHETGCAACHRPSFTTSADVHHARHLGGQRIWPYTDQLLHDMGEGLSDRRADGEPSGDARARSWRTPPLWGIGRAQAGNPRAAFLHDGRAGDIQEAILWHGGQAKRARDNYAAMPKAGREALLLFLKSL